MKHKIIMPLIDFGQPEAEHDHNALRNSFYISEGWTRLNSARQMPFLVGRKGSGKSAVATRLEIESESDSNFGFIRIVPDDFRHVEIRSLLSTLVNSSTSWQYIYSLVWEGILIGQIIKNIKELTTIDDDIQVSPELKVGIKEFCSNCDFYVNAIDDALSKVLTEYVTSVSKKTDELALVELREMLEPYKWSQLFETIKNEYHCNPHLPEKIIIVIDGLDEHWDVSKPSLHFLAKLLSVTKKLTAKFNPHIQFLVCLRDNIFRALVDTKSIEYDKIESLVINLQWDSSSLFELISRRVCPKGKPEAALSEIRQLLPDEMEGYPIDDYLGMWLLSRPRDYINFFRMLQANCGTEARAGAGHINDTLSQYSSNRLTDLENEFGFTYPGIAKCVASFSEVSGLLEKAEILSHLDSLISENWFRAEAPELILNYGDPLMLARILLSVGVIGCYRKSSNTVRFVHEFSESRVASLWDSTEQFSIHPIYQSRSAEVMQRIQGAEKDSTTPQIVTHPADYLPAKDAPGDLEPIEKKNIRKRLDLIAELKTIVTGQQHFSRWENWVKSTLDVSFTGDLLFSQKQITIPGGGKRFEMMFDIYGKEPPWQEIKGKYGTHRLLVECKNTEIPTDEDFSKLLRDMDSLDLNVAILAYREIKREPGVKVLAHQRSRYQNRKKEKVIIAMTQGFLLQCLTKKSTEKCRKNFSVLWRDHIQRWLLT